MASRHFRLAKQNGFTLVELAVVLVLAGLILALGVSSWQLVLHGRQVSKTQARLHQTKDCLLRHITHNLHYPKFNPSGLRPSDCADSDPSLGVTACLCASAGLDAWGNRIRYLAGTNGTSAVLNGQLATDLGPGLKASDPGQDSKATLGDGRIGHRIAFILLSLGADQEFDQASYQACFPGDDFLVGDLKDCSPDLSDLQDDQLLVVDGYELRGLLAN